MESGYAAVMPSPFRALSFSNDCLFSPSCIVMETAGAPSTEKFGDLGLDFHSLAERQSTDSHSSAWNCAFPEVSRSN